MTIEEKEQLKELKKLNDSLVAKLERRDKTIADKIIELDMKNSIITQLKDDVLSQNNKICVLMELNSKRDIDSEMLSGK